MNALAPLAHFAATAGAAAALARGRGEPLWTRYRCRELGVSFEVPFDMESEAPSDESPYAAVAQGCLILPYVFDVNYVASRGAADASPEGLSRAMAAQWAVDYRLADAPRIEPLALDGIENAWALAADIEDGVGLLGSSWVTLRHRGRIACLGVSYWVAEPLGHEACERLLTSISGD